MTLNEIFAKQLEGNKEVDGIKKVFWLQMVEEPCKMNADSLLSDLSNSEFDYNNYVPEIDLRFDSCRIEDLEEKLGRAYFCGYRVKNIPQFTSQVEVFERESKYLRQTPEK